MTWNYVIKQSRTEEMLSLYLIKHHAMKVYGGLEVCFLTFLTSALDGSEWSASHPGHFTNDIHWRRGWVTVESEKCLLLSQNQPQILRCPIRRHMVEWRCSSTILDLGTRWWWVDSFTPLLLYPCGKSPWYPSDMRLGGAQGQSGCCGKGKILHCWELISGRPAHSLSLYSGSML
jgi:hypothetical protein